jgi:hypothetical protein
MNCAVFLIITPLSLELVARYSYVRSEQMRIAGFSSYALTAGGAAEPCVKQRVAMFFGGSLPTR